MKTLAGLEVTSKAVKRTAEAIGEDIVQQEQEEIARAVQLDLPEMVGPQIPGLYVEMDGTGVPMVKKETADRLGKREGQSAHTREVKLGMRVHANHLGLRRPSAILIPPLTPAPSNAPRLLASGSMGKPGSAVGIVRL
jgi:hypothetical protein